jgi:hypothetical protein
MQNIKQAPSIKNKKGIYIRKLTLKCVSYGKKIKEYDSMVKKQ